MKVRTEFQVIVGADGQPAFLVVPDQQSCRLKGGFTRGTVPNEVVNLSFERGISLMAAWREHLGITRAAYAQMERVKQPRQATLQKVAEAMGLELEQLRW